MKNEHCIYLHNFRNVHPSQTEQIEELSDRLGRRLEQDDITEQDQKKHFKTLRQRRFGRRPYGYSDSKDEHHRKPWLGGWQTGLGSSR
jgi:hypothetical protein